MYLVKSLGDATAPTLPGMPDDVWAANQTRYVHDSLIQEFRNNPAAWTILEGPDAIDGVSTAMARASASEAGTIDAAGATVTESGVGHIHVTHIALNAVAVAVADADAFGTLPIYTFPKGRILILGSTGSIRWAVTSARDTTINNNASLTWSLGSDPATNATLANAMVDLIPKTTKTLAAATTALNTASVGNLATIAQFDGTTTALAANLNAGFETGTQISGDGTLAATGNITIHWINLAAF